jgi:hypothetical protein
MNLKNKKSVFSIRCGLQAQGRVTPRPGMSVLHLAFSNPQKLSNKGGTK